jgi:hypothetical protein
VLLEAQKQGAVGSWADADALACFMIATFHGLVLQREWGNPFSAEHHKKLLTQLLRAIVSGEKETATVN